MDVLAHLRLEQFGLHEQVTMTRKLWTNPTLLFPFLRNLSRNEG